MSEPAVRRLLHGLASHDAGLLLSVYHPQASYADPVHPDIRGARLGWLIRDRLAHFEHLQGEPLWIRGDERKGQMQWRLSWRRRGATFSQARPAWPAWPARPLCQPQGPATQPDHMRSALIQATANAASSGGSGSASPAAS